MPQVEYWRDRCGPLIEKSSSISVVGRYVLVEFGRVLAFVCDVQRYDDGLMVEVRLRRAVWGPVLVAGGSRDGLMLLEGNYQQNVERLREGQEPDGYFRLLPWEEATDGPRTPEHTGGR
ncbi:MAG: hypothetical protein Q8R28_05800 [Dehalococcoidia bacterium]|nr:hypothetical protein [Dehalococcoidia bacterium]